MDIETIKGEIAEIKARIASETKAMEDRISIIESEVRTVRDMARDSMHIMIGVDGKNGLRSVITELNGQVTEMREDFSYLKETAKGYQEIRGVLLKAIGVVVAGVLLNLGAVVWQASLNMTRISAIHQAEQGEYAKFKQEVDSMGEQVKQNATILKSLKK